MTDCEHGQPEWAACPKCIEAAEERMAARLQELEERQVAWLQEKMEEAQKVAKLARMLYLARDALTQISLASNNSMSTKIECGRIARKALKELHL